MRNSGLAGFLGVLIGLVILVLVGGAIALAFYIPGYNRAIRLEQAANEAWANVDTQLQRRLDLIPNLVETVRGYATQEKEIFENIAQARTRYFQTDTIEGKIEASNDLSRTLSRLLFLQERYPDLKASQNFRDLQVALEGTENRIAVARTRYNEAVRALNTFTREFVGSFFARRAGVEPKPFFETTEEARAAPPRVDFAPRAPAPAPQPNP
jgi:LemA protein